MIRQSSTLQTRFPARSTTAGSFAVCGALHGAAAWGAYSVVEYMLLVLSTAVSGTNILLAVHQWSVIEIVLSAYLCIGLVSGGLGGLVLNAVEKRGLVPMKPACAPRFRAMAVLTLTLAFIVNLLFVHPFGKAEALSLATTAVLVVGLSLSYTNDRWGQRTGFLRNPWAASLLLLGCGWTGRYLLSGAAGSVKLVGGVGTVLAVACTAKAGSALWKRFRLPVEAVLPVRAIAVVAVAGACVFGGSLLLSHRLPPVPPLQSRAAAGRPNVVLVTMDTVRSDHLSLSGYHEDTTPFLKELAKGATVYTNAIATADMTLPSHASLFTGLYGSFHGAHFAPPPFVHGRPLGSRYHTLAEILSTKGYRTMAVVANSAFLDRGFGLDRGFQVYDVRSRVALGDPIFLRNGFRRLMDVFVSTAEFDVLWWRAEEINQVAFAFLGRVKEETAPFFLFLNYMDAHVPYVPPAPFNDRFPGRNRHFGFAAYCAMQNDVMTGTRPVTAAEERHLISQYDGAVAYLDAHLARLVSKLRELDLFENTLIVITSDHGEAFGARNLVEHGVSVYQDQVHVPLIIKYPHRNQPQFVDTLVSHVDVLPTVLATLGLEASKGVQGRELQGGEGAAALPVVTESFNRAAIFNHRLERTERAVFSGKLKFISSTIGKRELYDLSHDPQETNDLYGSDGTQARALEAWLNEWVHAIPAPAAGPSSIDRGLVRRLRALGYVQ